MKSKDFYIFTVRFYASKYHVKKFLNGNTNSHMKHIEAANIYNEFFWKFIEKINGKRINDYIKLYSTYREAATEEINEYNDIKVIESGDGYRTFIIPKENNEQLFEWCKENAPNFKLLTRTSPLWLEKDHTTFYRNSFKHSPEFIEKLKDL
jgi:hypothetical protein